jgi:hypothetical protein
MDKCDLEPEQPAVGLLVDQLDAPFGQVLELAPEVGHLVSDVVHAGATIRQELADWGLLPEGREQLDPAVADTQPLIRVYGLVEILDGEPEMMNPLRLHGEADAIRC